VVVLDDVGFSQLGCYGSRVNTRTMDRLADEGIRYVNFHVTSLCSPTRACLLTGRNHHAVGVGCVANWDTGFPGYRGRVTARAATLAEMLRGRGYATSALGKWHLTPSNETTAAGPYHEWPLNRGFDRFYGFLGAWTNHWAPELWQDNQRIPTPSRPGYHLSADLVDHAIGFIRDQISVEAQRPFFLYLAFGACHAPFHAPSAFIDRYRGAFDDGWDAYRLEAVERQKRKGLFPVDTLLAPRNEGVPAWSALSHAERRLYARWNEVFAGFLDHADHELGRLVAYLEEVGAADNTLLILLSDNGASSEGGNTGQVNYLRAHLNRAAATTAELEDAEAAFDVLGGPETLGIYPQGWAQAGNTPLKWYKGNTFGGGVRAPLIIRWPEGIGHPGSTRSEFAHAIDIVPTVLEAVGMDAPDQVGGVPQLPIHGTSIAQTFRIPAGGTVVRPPQYFEMYGHRGLWHNGWKAVTYHRSGTNFDDDQWELYHLASDFSECTDLADEQPALRDALVALWWAEARRFDVLPLDDRRAERLTVIPPNSFRARESFVYRQGMAGVPSGAAPDVINRSFSIEAAIGEPGDGVVLAHGGRFGGYSLFVLDGHPHFAYNSVGRPTVVKGTTPLPAGPSAISVAFVKTGDYCGTVAVAVDGKECGSGALENTLRNMSVSGEGLYCGRDAQTPVSSLHPFPFTFSGVIEHVRVHVDGTRTATSPADQFEAELHEE
jgi:arylsulfatase